MSITGKRLVTAMVAGTLAAAGLAVPAVAASPAHDTTSAKERQRVDRVPTPKLSWYKCYGTAECATTRLPLDYDQPKGATTEIAVLRIKATDQAHKIGTLFLNPGGPGGSGTQIALFAPAFLGPDLLAKFDIVGFDPRGIASSDNLKCFPSVQAQSAAETPLISAAFPLGAAQEADWVKAAKQVGKACSTTGEPLSGAMSTAEVARDMDVLRRAVGDKKLSYLGFSYGTALGQYYANMFPDRFRALVVDGVLDPEHWAGTKATANEELDARIRSADGAYRALIEILNRCAAAGPKYCEFAGGNTTEKFAAIAASLKSKPVVITDPADGSSFTVTYADFIGATLGALYGTTAGAAVASIAQELWTAINAPSPAADAVLVARIREARAKKPAKDFPYDNSAETFWAVTCTDTLEPTNAALWPALMAKADRRAPYFGRAWGWSTVPCARNTWTVRDEDAYTGPWHAKTDAPVLFVGNKWDPATNYDDAVSGQKRLPNSGLLSNLNWGHTSYGTSACATNAVDSYLLTGKLPQKGTVCVGDDQPFTTPIGGDPTQLHATKVQQGRPPVATNLPVSILTGTR